MTREQTFFLFATKKGFPSSWYDRTPACGCVERCSFLERRAYSGSFRPLRALSSWSFLRVGAEPFGRTTTFRLCTRFARFLMTGCRPVVPLLQQGGGAGRFWSHIFSGRRTKGSSSTLHFAHSCICFISAASVLSVVSASRVIADQRSKLTIDKKKDGPSPHSPS